jgi:hypothetical protein
MSETCTALTHDFGDNIEPCKRPALRAGYCAVCLPSIAHQALTRLSTRLAEVSELAAHVFELVEPRDRSILFLNFESQLTEIKRNLAEKIS